MTIATLLSLCCRLHGTRCSFPFLLGVVCSVAIGLWQVQLCLPFAVTVTPAEASVLLSVPATFLDSCPLRLVVFGVTLFNAVWGRETCSGDVSCAYAVSC